MTPGVDREPPRILAGINAVREALRAGAALRFVAVSRGRHDARVAEILTLAQAAGVPVRQETPAALDRLAHGLVHQGIVAEAEAKAVVTLEALLDDAPAQCLLALDGIEDPQNLGAIIRLACGAGVDGILLPARRSAGLSPAVARVSAGALEHVRCARVGNLVQALEQCKQRGWWVAGLDADAQTTIWDYDFTAPTVLVVGAEGAGLHALTRKRCDTLVSIPLASGSGRHHSTVASLNAAMAAGIALFEVVRQRRRTH